MSLRPKLAAPDVLLVLASCLAACGGREREATVEIPKSPAASAPAIAAPVDAGAVAEPAPVAAPVTVDAGPSRPKASPLETAVERAIHTKHPALMSCASAAGRPREERSDVTLDLELGADGVVARATRGPDPSSLPAKVVDCLATQVRGLKVAPSLLGPPFPVHVAIPFRIHDSPYDGLLVQYGTRIKDPGY